MLIIPGSSVLDFFYNVKAFQTLSKKEFQLDFFKEINTSFIVRFYFAKYNFSLDTF